MTINEIQDEIIEEFSLLDDWMDRYQLLIDMGEGEQALPAADKTESNLIDGCQSRVWLVCDSLLIRVMTDHTPDEILAADLYFIDRIGLREHLSPTRSNGLLAMVKQMRMYALAYKTKAAQ